MGVLFACFFGFLLIRMPVGFCMLCSSMIYALVYDESLDMLLSRAVAGSSGFTLLALAFFMLAGDIMNRGGITTRIFNFAKKLVGWLPGGMGMVNVVDSVIFAGMSGSAVADAAGIGAMELKAMKDDGYDDDFAISITGGSSCIGPIIPPSISGVVFAMASGVSTGAMLIGGILPGFLMALVQMIYIYIVAKKRNYPRIPFKGFRDLGISAITTLPALMTPVIILRCIATGVCTPTEASVIAVVYAIILGFIVKDLSIKDLPSILDDTITTTMGVLFIVSAANSFGYIITAAQIPTKLAEMFMAVITNKYVALLIINVFLLCVGMVMESLSALTILVPILMPVVYSFGIDPVHFGIICILNITIGMLTPPVGMVLFTLANVTKKPFEKVAHAMLPMIAINCISLLIITYCPPLVTWLPSIML